MSAKIISNADGTWTDQYGRQLVAYTWEDTREAEGSPHRRVPSVRVVEDGHDAGSVHAHYDATRGFYETSEQMARRAAEVFTPHWHTVTEQYRAHHAPHRVKHAVVGWNIEGGYDPEEHAKKKAAYIAALTGLTKPGSVTPPPPQNPRGRLALSIGMRQRRL